MPNASSVTKTEMVATRVTPKIKKIVDIVATGEGLSTSEWIRKLIVLELHKNESFSSV
jgi:hypothetical protein